MNSALDSYNVVLRHFEELHRTIVTMNEDIEAFSEANLRNNFSESFELHCAQVTIDLVKLNRKVRSLQNTVWYGTPPKKRRGALISGNGK